MQLKSDWSKHKKAIITVTSRIYCFWLSSKIFLLTSCMLQMEPSCRLSARCLKKDEPLEVSYSLGCLNLIHPSCFKKVMCTVAENEWDVLFSVASDVSTTTRKCSRQPQANTKVGYHGKQMG